jgi:hypothetical protein
LGGALLGLGASAMMGAGKSKSQYSSMLDSRSDYESAAQAMPAMPETPAAPDDGGAAKNESMLAAEEEERRKRAAAAAANAVNVTGGLGLTTPANVQRKTLLG